MVLDYSERRQVSKNRPVKKGIGLWIVLSVVVLSVTFAGGFLTGWLAGKAQRKVSAGDSSAKADSGQTDSRNSAGPSPVTGTAGGIDPPLTFYNTLPKGSKAVIGSGINAPTPQAKHAGAVPASPSHVEPSQVAPVKLQEAVPANTPGDKQPAAGDKVAPAKTVYLVQVASYKEKREAEEIRDKLVARGIAAYLAESRVKDKGVWFRVRVGKGLNQKEAGELATKLGKGALVLPE